MQSYRAITWNHPRGYKALAAAAAALDAKRDQLSITPAHDGQPSRRSAWGDPELNAVSGHFYRNTADTLEAACVRQRHAGYIPFQAGASALLGEALQERAPAGPVLEKLQAMYRASRAPGGEA